MMNAIIIAIRNMHHFTLFIASAFFWRRCQAKPLCRTKHSPQFPWPWDSISPPRTCPFVACNFNTLSRPLAVIDIFYRDFGRYLLLLLLSLSGYIMPLVTFMHSTPICLLKRRPLLYHVIGPWWPLFPFRKTGSLHYIFSSPFSLFCWARITRTSSTSHLTKLH